MLIPHVVRRRLLGETRVADSLVFLGVQIIVVVVDVQVSYYNLLLIVLWASLAPLSSQILHKARLWLLFRCPM